MDSHLAFAMAALLAGCAQPAASPPALQAGTGPEKPATTCTVVGFTWRLTGQVIAPSMTTSSDGFCIATVRLHSSTAMSMEAVSQPQHGRVVASGASAAPYVRYYANPGYEGPDSFTVNTGSGGGVKANFAVTVVK